MGETYFFNISGGEPFLRKDLPQIVAAAPAAIKADVETAAKAFVDFRKALEAIDFDPQKIPDTIALDPEVQAASDRVDAYASEHCPES